MFTILIEHLLDRAISWGAGKIINGLSQCLKCKQKDKVKLANQELNTLECSNNCKKPITQWINACPFTLNGNELATCNVWAEREKWTWENLNREFETDKTFWDFLKRTLLGLPPNRKQGDYLMIEFDYHIVGLWAKGMRASKDVLLEATITPYDYLDKVDLKEFLTNTQYQNYKLNGELPLDMQLSKKKLIDVRQIQVYQRQVFAFHLDSIPENWRGKILTVKTNVKSAKHDIIGTENRLITPFT